MRSTHLLSRCRRGKSGTYSRMADIDAGSHGLATPSSGHVMPGVDTVRTRSGSALFAMGMLVWAFGQLVYEATAVGACALFLLGGVGASVGLRLAVGLSWSGRVHTEWLTWALTAMLVLFGISASLDGAVQVIAVSLGVSVLVVGFAHAMAQLRSAQLQLAELAVVDARQRVAADVHDIVGHALAVTMLHVNAARLSLPQRPDAAIEALEEAERNGRSSMNEIRSVVRLLRSHDGPSLQSLPDLDDLPALVQSFTGSGQLIEVTGEIDHARVSRLASVTLYRLAQEGLTNAVKYGTGTIIVRLAMVDDDVVAEIVNEIAAPHHDLGGGVGLDAARARVHSIGGTIESGPIDGDRWRLGVRVPA